MAPGQSATRAAVVLRAGNLVVHVNSLDAINAVVQALSQFCTPASPTSAKDGGPGTDKPQAHDLVRNAAEEATRYLCNVSERHANGLHQALVPWRKRMTPELLRDLRDLHTAAAVCRHATVARFASLLEALREAAPVPTGRPAAGPEASQHPPPGQHGCTQPATGAAKADEKGGMCTSSVSCDPSPTFPPGPAHLDATPAVRPRHGSGVGDELASPPPAGTGACSAADVLRHRTVCIYREKNPAVLGQMGTFMAEFKGREQEMYLKVCDKYGITPLPPPGEPLAGTLLPANEVQCTSDDTAPRAARQQGARTRPLNTVQTVRVGPPLKGGQACRAAGPASRA